MSKLASGVFLFLTFFTTGCATVWIAPAYEGLVVGPDGKGVAGASITRHHFNDTQTIGTTDENGHFHIQADSEFRFPHIFGDPVSRGSYVFSKDGYTSGEVKWDYCCGDAFRKTSLNSKTDSKVILKQSK